MTSSTSAWVMFSVRWCVPSCSPSSLSGRGGWGVRASLLFIPQRLDRMQGGGFAGRIDAKEQPYASRDRHGSNYRRRVHDGFPTGDRGQNGGRTDADADADETAKKRDDRGLDEELHQDVARRCADSFADADLAGALGDGDQHDVHDADAADDERDARNRAQQPRHGARGLCRGVGDFFLATDGEIVVPTTDDAVTLPEQRGDIVLYAGGNFG